jgi:6-phosphogluconate dehydrogenase
MKRNISLDDNDREEWLILLNNELKNELNKDIVIACSALKEIYRMKLISGLNANFFWFCLKGDFELINQRLKKRNNHFFKSELLKSQFDILEYPKYANFIDIAESPEKIVETIKLKILK